MKLRHAAALVLTGWYLMLPPVESCRDAMTGHPCEETALSSWTIAGTFDSASACETLRNVYAENGQRYSAEYTRNMERDTRISSDRLPDLDRREMRSDRRLAAQGKVGHPRAETREPSHLSSCPASIVTQSAKSADFSCIFYTVPGPGTVWLPGLGAGRRQLPHGYWSGRPPSLSGSRVDSQVALPPIIQHSTGSPAHRNFSTSFSAG